MFPMNTVTISINVVFFVAVLATIIIRRIKIDFSDDAPGPKPIRGITRLLIGESVTWVVFNLATLNYSQILAERSARDSMYVSGHFSELLSGMYLGFAPTILVFINIVLFGFFIYVLITKSKPGIIAITIFWLLINVTIKLIALIVCIILGLLFLLWILSEKPDPTPARPWFWGSKKSQGPGQYDPRYYDSKGNKLG